MAAPPSEIVVVRSVILDVAPLTVIPAVAVRSPPMLAVLENDPVVALIGPVETTPVTLNAPAADIEYV